MYMHTVYIYINWLLSQHSKEIQKQEMKAKYMNLEFHLGWKHKVK